MGGVRDCPCSYRDHAYSCSMIAMLCFARAAPLDPPTAGAISG
jgi:hypothetical protein